MAAALRYTKAALPAASLLAHLEGRGLTIADPAKALHALEHVGYYRLLIYMRAVQGPAGGHRAAVAGAAVAPKWFNPGATFEQVVGLYEFDRRLRLLCLDAIERVEVAIRTAINDRIATIHGPHFYEDSAYFRAPSKHFEHSKLLLKLDEAESLGIAHYQATYGTPVRPPIWVALESSDFGTLSRFYSGLIPAEQDRVARAFGLPAAVLVSWFRTTVTLRNTCAHHGRLWNATLNVNAPMRAHKYAAELTKVNTAYARLVVLAVLLGAVDLEAANWRRRLRQLFRDFPHVEPAQLGCPPGWESRPLWH